MDLELLAWPPDGPKLRLDHERFAYAGKFVMTNTGKAVARVEDDPVERANGTGQDEGGVRRGDDEVGRGENGTNRGVNGGDASDVVAAAAFDADRTDPATLRLRYVTVARERRGEGIGPRLCAFVASRGFDREYERVRIAVNNPYAYEALYKAGFGFTGEGTGIAELVLERPGDRSAGRYRDGLARFRERDLTDEERAFLDAREGAGPPAVRDEN